MQESSNLIDPKIRLCGFRNIGNTCYINSIIQLLHSKNLLVYFVQICEDKYFINLMQTKCFYVLDDSSNVASALSRGGLRFPTLSAAL